MQRVVLDEPTRAKLLDLGEVLEVRDENGRVLGHFLPLHHAIDGGQESSRCPHTDEEIEQLRRQTGGRPLSEIWKSLGRNV